MEFQWIYRYVPEGQIEPDEYGRWALECYIRVNIDKALPQYEWCKQINKEYLHVRVATMFQKNTKNGHVMSTIHKFGAGCPSFKDAGNTGFSPDYYFYSNDIDELKQIIEAEIIKVQKVFINTK